MSTPDMPTDLKRARSGRHVPVLDGVRGLAILMVLVYHCMLCGGMTSDVAVDKIVRAILSAGWSGVDLFFVLSGFLITGILLDAKQGPHFFRSFYARRVLRIFPLYFLFLLGFIYVLPWLYHMGRGFELLQRDQAWYWSYLVNVQIALDGWPEYAALGHFWSLAVEEQFYLVWPFLVFAVRRETLMRICVACIVVPPLVRLGLSLRGEITAAQVLTITRLDALAVGGLLAAWIRDPTGPDPRLRHARPVLVGGLLALGAMFFWYKSFWTEIPAVHILGFTLIALTAGSLLASLLVAPGDGPISRLFRHPFMRFMGKYSYGIYVLHHPLLVFLGKSRFAVHTWPRFQDSQLPGLLVVVVIGVGVSTALAVVSWHVLEAPFLRLKRLFPYGRRSTA